ncbi:DsrE family protein [Parapedobacter sp. ISTM3]|uniref:DsrE family protein n=1 Tax=Parapedobacter sp. ISTM3 TaxID=2800130 RepID=UPI0019044005|nr:DsrE family protein [Parapedobacter sp. ISTM3]MBK1439895.1 DsrE family protein [Parapedobacter sp. ISTM3]
MKKQIVILAFVIFGLSWYVPSYGQAQSLSGPDIESLVRKDGSYAMLVQGTRHFMGAMLVGENIKEEHPSAQFEIVMAGEIVKELASNKDLKKQVETAKKYGIKLVVCEFAMQRLGVTKAQYNPYVQTTPNAYRYLFGLQELGFKTITL